MQTSALKSLFISAIANACNVDSDSICLEARVSDLGVDSLVLVSIINQIALDYDVALTSDQALELFEAESIRDLLLKAQSAIDESAAYKGPGTACALPANDASPSSSLVASFPPPKRAIEKPADIAAIRFNRFASQNPGVVALVDPSGRKWSRGELATSAKRLSHLLRKLGCTPGDTLATIAPNCAEYMIAYLAATQSGLYFVPINWHLAPAEIEYILKDCKARALVAHERFQPLMTSVLSGMDPQPPIRLSIGSLEGFVDLAKLEDVDGEADPQLVDGRMLAYTSATTGRPKGVLLPLRDAGRILDKIIEQRIAGGWDLEKNVHLCASMLYHGAPLENAAIALHMGHVAVLVDTATPEGILRLIEEHQVTTAYIPPTMFKRLVRLSPSTRARYSISSLARVAHTGVSCPVEVKRQMIEWWGPILSELYGAVEGAGTIAHAHDWLKYPGTVGKPLPGTSIRIIDENGEELPPSSVGTIYLTRYTGERFEYLGDREKTEAAYRGEFFTVGDVGYLNEEGFLFLCGRKIDMINVGGLKVYSAEVENALTLHQDVVDCAVIGVPDDITGEAVLALVQVASDAPKGDALKGELVRFLLRHLSPLKTPREFEFVASLPRDATGKLRKKELRTEYLSRRTPRPS